MHVYKDSNKIKKTGTSKFPCHVSKHTFSLKKQSEVM